MPQAPGRVLRVVALTRGASGRRLMGGLRGRRNGSYGRSTQQAARGGMPTCWLPGAARRSPLVPSG